MKNLNELYADYVQQMERCHQRDMQRCGANCPNAFIPRSFDEWKNSAVEVSYDLYTGFFVTVLDERVSPSFTTSAAAHTYRQGLI